MFIWDRGDELWVTPQTEHMSQSGDFAARWGAGRVLPPRSQVGAVLAARHHDEGWREWELVPDMDEHTGHPYDFRAVPREKHSAFYGRGVEFLAQASAYGSALVSRHATGLYLGRYGVDGERVPSRDELPDFSRTFVEEQERYQAEVVRRLGVSEEDVWHDYRLLQAWDRLSICFCHGRDEMVLGPVPAEGSEEGLRIEARRVDTHTVRLSPFPFPGDEQPFPVRMFRYPSRRYSSWRELEELQCRTPADVGAFRAVA